MSQTYEDFFGKSACPDSYARQNFEVRGFFPSAGNGTRNVLTRVLNTVIHALNTQEQLPMLISLVLDNDLIKAIRYEGKDIQEVYKKEITWLTKQIRRAITTKKDYYPSKALLPGQPHLILLQPPCNTNFRDNQNRMAMARAMKQAADEYQETSALGLKQLWDEGDTNLFLRYQNRYTSTGKARYWDAVDRTVRYAHTVNFRNNRFQAKKAKPARIQQENTGNKKRTPRSDHSNSAKIAWKQTVMSKLPTPPPRKFLK